MQWLYTQHRKKQNLSTDSIENTSKNSGGRGIFLKNIQLKFFHGFLEFLRVQRGMRLVSMVFGILRKNLLGISKSVLFFNSDFRFFQEYLHSSFFFVCLSNDSCKIAGRIFKKNHLRDYLSHHHLVSYNENHQKLLQWLI